MTSLVRAISSATQNRSNLILTIVVLLFVVAMFFIPELVDLQKRFGRSEGVEIAEVESVEEEGRASVSIARLSETEEVNPTSLKDISSMLEGGYIDRVRDRKLAGLGVQSADGAAAPADEAVDALGQRKITWESFKEPSVNSALGRARAASQDLLKDIPGRAEGVRFALFSYANGIQVVREGGEPGMTPEAAYSYLESLDAAVTRAMVREGVDRDLYRRWQAITLGPLFATSRLARTKAQFQMAFNPGMQLEKVRIFKPGQVFREQGPVYVHIFGYLRGEDVKRIAAYEDGVFKGNLALKAPDINGIRRFSWIQRDARKVYTFVAYDKFGETYEKSYQFYPAVRRFPWTPKRLGTFLVNFRSGLVDPSIDRYFRYRGRGSVTEDGASNRMFVTF